MLLTPGPALAQYVGTPAPTVASAGEERCVAGSTDPACIVVQASSAGRERCVAGSTDPSCIVVQASSAERGGDSLPVTGGDLAGLAAMGVGAVAVGVVMLRRGRTRPLSR